MADSHMYWKGGAILEAENQEQQYECFVYITYMYSRPALEIKQVQYKCTFKSKFLSSKYRSH